MKQTVSLALAASLALLAVSAGHADAGPHVAGTLWSASEVLESLQAVPERCVPPALLHDAQGVAIIPGVIKIGFGLGGRFGQGIVLARNPDGSWSNPLFITLTGGSIGWQAGVQSTDVVLVFGTRKGLDRILEGKGKLTLGSDVAVAAGPVGRQAEAATDLRLGAEILSYSRTRGLFAGVALEGAAILQDRDANAAFYQQTRPEDVQAAEKLKAQLAAMAGVPVQVVPSAPPPLAPPVIVAPPPPAYAPAPPSTIQPPQPPTMPAPRPLPPQPVPVPVPPPPPPPAP